MVSALVLAQANNRVSTAHGLPPIKPLVGIYGNIQ
jgi:hypothetical protein